MRFKLIAVCLIAFLMFSANGFCQESSGKDSLIGLLSATRDTTGSISGAALEAETYDENDNVVTVTYSILMDETGKALAEKFDGAEVKVTGTIKDSPEAGKSRSIVVTSFEGTSEEIPTEPLEEELGTEADAPDIDLSGDDAPDVDNSTALIEEK